METNMSTQHTPGPVAQKLNQGVALTEWRVTLSDARVYVANTYPGSDLVYIENTKGRQVRGAVIEREVRAAISKATGSAS